MRFFIILFSFLFFSSGSVFSQSSAELKRRKAKLAKEISQIRRSLNQTSSNKKLSLRQIDALNAQINLREEMISTIESEVRTLDAKIFENTSTVRNLQSELNKLKKEYASMVRFAGKNQNAYNKLVFIFAARDFNQAYMRLRYLQQFGEYRRRQAKYIQETARELGIKIVELDRDKKDKTNILEDKEKEKETLSEEKQHKAVLVSRLSKQEVQLQKQLKQKQAESIKLNRAINAAIAREIAAARRRAEARAKAAAAARAKAGSNTGTKPAAVAKGSSVLSATPEAAKLSTSFAGNRGKLPWPVASGRIIQGFGSHGYGVNVTIQNNGVDIVTPKGATVRAVFEGTVATVIDMGNGVAVLVQHGEYFTVYSNLRSASVSRGQKVSIKQSIGTVLTNTVDGTTQLHFEVRKGASPLNPSGWLSR